MTARIGNLAGAESRVSVVIAVRNGGTDIERCLDAIERQTLSPLEVIVVDDQSTDDTVARLRTRSDLRILELDRCSGPAAARNRGALIAAGDLLFFTDADVCLAPDAIEVATATFAEHDDLSAVIGSYDDDPGHPAFLSQYKNLFHHWVHQSSSEVASTFWTGCGVVRREVFLDVGGFNEGYPKPSIEDIEFGFRLRNGEHRIRLEKALLGKHIKHWRFWNLLHTDVFRRGVPWIALLLRDRFAPKDLNLSSESKIGTIMAYLFAAALPALALLGHAAMTLPAIAFLLAAVACSKIWRPGASRRLRTPLAVVLAAGAPLATALATGQWLGLALLLPLAWIVRSHRPFYAFLTRVRGGAFAIATVPMHLLFLLSCGLCLPLGIAARRLDRRRARQRLSGPAIRDLSPLPISHGQQSRHQQTHEAGT